MTLTTNKIIFLVGIILIVIGATFLFFNLYTDGMVCMNAPIEYAERSLNTSCFCIEDLLN